MVLSLRSQSKYRKRKIEIVFTGRSVSIYIHTSYVTIYFLPKKIYNNKMTTKKRRKENQYDKCLVDSNIILLPNNTFSYNNMREDNQHQKYALQYYY